MTAFRYDEKNRRAIKGALKEHVKPDTNFDAVVGNLEKAVRYSIRAKRKKKNEQKRNDIKKREQK